ncbi:unnamed protein product [Rhodiola kirilowii]
MKNDGDGRDLERGRSKRNERVESRGDEDNGREGKDMERKRSRRSNMDEDFRAEIRDRWRRNSDDEDDRRGRRRRRDDDGRRGDKIGNDQDRRYKIGRDDEKNGRHRRDMEEDGRGDRKEARMMKEVQDKSSVEYQRLTWDALHKSINGLVNKVNATNIKNIIPQLFADNLIRGRGLFCRSCMKSQMTSPGFTDIFSALVAVVNTKFPEVGELILKRIVLQLKRAYKRNDKTQLLAAVKFVAHLVNQQVAHEIIALELLTLLLENPTDCSVEVAVGFVTECGSILQDLSPKGLHGILERFRGIIHGGEIDKRVQFLIEGLFAVRKAKFQGHPAVRPELDLVQQEEQITHEISLADDPEADISLDIFKVDPNFVENEKRYEAVEKSIVGEDSDDEEGSDGSEDEDESDEDKEDEEKMRIQDKTETNLVNLRRTIYVTIMSTLDFEEAGHKLQKIKLEPGQEMELCIIILECCSQERTYLRYYGLLGRQFCMINKIYQENFETCLKQQYSMIHLLGTNKLCNVAMFFAHLLSTDALPWHDSLCLMQELSEHLGIRLRNEQLSDPTMQVPFESIFTKDNVKNMRFIINFFTLRHNSTQNTL